MDFAKAKYSAESELYCDENLFTKPGSVSPSAYLICTETLDIDQQMQIVPETNQVPFYTRDSEEYIKDLQSSEPIYHPSFPQLSHPPNQVMPYMRAMVIDNMQMVCANFKCTRQTFHASINLIDRIISQDPEILKENFQLYGIVSIYLAGQIYDNTEKKPSYLLRTTDNQFNELQFKSLMHRFLRLLQWRMTPVTRYDILVYSLKEWDRFLSIKYRQEIENTARLGHINGLSQDQTVLYWSICFLTFDQYAESRYLKILNILDTCSLNLEINRFSPSSLVSGLLYVVISYYIRITNYAMLGFNSAVHEFSQECESMLIESTSSVLFLFLSSCLNLESLDLLDPVISFILLFINCPEQDEPTVMQEDQRHLDESSQTFNQHSLQWLFENNL